MLRQFDELKQEKISDAYPMHPCTDEEFSRFYTPNNPTTAEKTKRL